MRFLYNERGTVVHRMSPQAKLIGVLISFIFPVAFNHPAYLAVVAAFALGYVTVAEAWDVLARFRRLILVLFVVSCLLWSVLLKAGEPIFHWGPILGSPTSLLVGIAMGLRVTTYVVIGLAFLATTSVEELTSALRGIGLPFSFGFALSTSFRLVPTFVETTKSVTEAQRARGLSLEHGGPVARAKKYLPLFIPILAICIRRASTMAMALEARGFGAQGSRTSFCRSRLSGREGVLLVVIVLAAAGAIFLRVTGHGELVPGRL
jgi:energy-coupling factor transporter transmembrane protein EcfT